MNFLNDPAHLDRQRFILSRDRYGMARYVLRRWWHDRYLHVALVVMLYLFASTIAYREEVEQANERADKAEIRAVDLQQFQRADSVTFVIEAQSLDELDRKYRAVRNASNDALIHSAAARK